jgi:pimeloyl-ACP methyl ester carboxylesterase
VCLDEHRGPIGEWTTAGGDPLVYLPPAFGHAGTKSFPSLTGRHTVITVDLQGQGRTADLPDRPLSLEQHAEDVIALLEHLGVRKADFFGESYGGVIATMVALRRRDLVARVATCGATFGPPDVAHNPEMLRFDEPPTAESRAFRVQRESYRQVAPDPERWSTLWNKVSAMRWDGFSRAELAAVAVPLLIVVGDHDFVRLEHAIEAFRSIRGAELAVIPDAGHFMLFSEPERVLPIVRHFLEKPATRPPLATAGVGYQPGETR